jgi:hypothetical protein
MVVAILNSNMEEKYIEAENSFKGVQNAKDGKNRVINRVTRQKEEVLAKKSRGF